jgi:hypothetical protein
MQTLHLFMTLCLKRLCGSKPHGALSALFLFLMLEGGHTANDRTDDSDKPRQQRNDELSHPASSDFKPPRFFLIDGQSVHFAFDEMNF